MTRPRKPPSSVSTPWRWPFRPPSSAPPWLAAFALPPCRSGSWSTSWPTICMFRSSSGRPAAPAGPGYAPPFPTVTSLCRVTPGEGFAPGPPDSAKLKTLLNLEQKEYKLFYAGNPLGIRRASRDMLKASLRSGLPNGWRFALNKRYAAFPLIALALVAAGAAHAQTLQFSPSSVSLYALNTATSSAQQTINVTSSDNTTVIPFNLAPNTAWISVLSATPSGGWKTPASVTIGVNPSLLPLGTSTGLLNFSGTGFFQQVTVNVTVSTIGVTLPVTGGQTSILQLGTYQAGSTVYPPAISALTVVGDTTNLKITQGATDNWYTFQQFGTQGSIAVQVSFNPAVAASLSPGTLTGALTLTPELSNPPVTIPISLIVTPSPQVTVTPASLIFNWQRGGANVTQQYLTLTSNSSQAIVLNVSAPGISWVTLPVSNPTIPANGSVQVAVTVPPPAGDAQPTGANNGLIQISMPGGGGLFPNGSTSQSIPILLNVSNYPVMFVQSSTLGFTSRFGSSTATPASQVVAPTTSGAAVSYTAAGVPSDNWVIVAPPAGSILSTDSGSFTVSVNPAGLAPGTYQSRITVTPQPNGSGQGPLTIPVSLTVTFPNVLQTNIPANSMVCAGTPCLVFQYQNGQARPASQTVNLSSTTAAPLNYTITPPAATAAWIQ